MKNILFIFTALLILGFTSCVDNVIDEPPVKGTPVIETNATVSSLLDLWVSGQNKLISEDLVLDAVVVADDESGNFYKSIVIQDETGGLTVRIEANNVYSILPVGRQVYIRAKGLYLGDYNGLIQLGYGDDDGDLLTIPFNLINDSDEAVIVPGERDQTVVAATSTINGLNSSHLSTLIVLEDVQFSSSELGSTYADGVNQQTENRTIEDCDGNTIIVRTSGFSDFASEVIPDGKGTLTCVYTVFGSTQQLVVRDVTDLAMTSDRCGVVVVELPEPNATIADLLALFQSGAPKAVTDDLIVDAVVVGNDISGNIFKTIYVQDETGGISIPINDFDLFETYPLGKRIAILAQNLAVGDFGGSGNPQIGILDGTDVGRIDDGVYKNLILPGENVGEPAAQVFSVTDILDATSYNTLIKINEVEFADASVGQTYADAVNMFSVNHDVTDCDGNVIILRSSGFADFAGATVDGGNGSITALFTTFQGTKQLVIRRQQDVSFNGDRCDGGGNSDLEELNEDFSSLVSDDDANLTGWTNVATVGVRKWIGKEFSGNRYLQASAFNDTESVMETWIITPKIIMNGNNTLNFTSAKAFFTHDGLSAMISTDFNGDPTTATWTDLGATLAQTSDADHDWVASGNIDLSSYSGKAVIGFKYSGGAGAGNTGTFRIDDLVITK